MPKDKQATERRLIERLQRDHGYMFADMPRERDRYTTQVRGIRSGKVTMTLARVVRLIAPDKSWLAQAVEIAAKTKKTPRGRKAKR